MKQYKYKRHQEQNTLDKKPIKIRKQLNSSERQRAKRLIKNQEDDLLKDEAEWKSLRWEINERIEDECILNSYAFYRDLLLTLSKLDFLTRKQLFRILPEIGCKCDNVNHSEQAKLLYSMSKQQFLHYISKSTEYDYLKIKTHYENDK